MNRRTVESALAQGFNIFCATCEHLYEGREKGLPACAKQDTCGGPLSNRAFPDYKGVIPRDRSAEICLICGSPEISYLVVVERVPKFGLCRIHRKALEVVPELSEAGKPAHAPILVPLGRAEKPRWSSAKDQQANQS